MCKFIDHVFDLIYELATRESDQYFIQCNGWPGRLVMQSVCFVFNSISFEQIGLVMRHLWVDIEDTGHSANWPAVRIILPAWPDRLVESSVQIALPAHEKHPAENINKTPATMKSCPEEFHINRLQSFCLFFTFCRHRPECQMHCIPSYCHPGGLWDVMLEVYHGL